MSKTVTFIAALPYEAYKSYKREVDYEYDRYYDEASDDDWGIEPMCTVLKEIIEDEGEVWEYLMKEAYAYGDTFWRLGDIRAEIIEAVTSHVSELVWYDKVESMNVEVESRVAQLTITFKDDISDIDESTVKDLLSILAKDVFQVTCHERLSNFDLVDYVKYIDECDVYLDLEDQVSPSDLEYTIEYK